MISEDHVTLKTGEMMLKNSFDHRNNYILLFIQTVILNCKIISQNSYL